MNIVKQGNCFDVYNENDFQIYDRLPAGNYILNFHKMRGFYLSAAEEASSLPDRIYGKTISRTKKVLDAFTRENRNLGVMCVGQKGSGKTLFAKHLCLEAAKLGLPTIAINGPVPGLEDFINKIDQEVVILFDEFDKTFSMEKRDDMKSPQDELLGLFDGYFSSKKLFFFTANSIGLISNYLINRPGRVRYAFYFSDLTPDKAREFLIGECPALDEDTINKICNISARTPLTYDSLSAIIVELNAGYSLEETLEDLNITVENTSVKFEGTISTNFGAFRSTEWVDFEKDTDTFWFYNCDCGTKRPFDVGVRFKPMDLAVNTRDGSFYLTENKIEVLLDEEDFGSKEECQKFKQQIQITKARFVKFNTLQFKKQYLV